MSNMCKEADNIIRQHFIDLGFTNHISSSGDGCVESWANLDSEILVEIRFNDYMFSLSYIHGMVHCSIENCTFPNKNIPEFIRQLERHTMISKGDL